MKRSDVLFIVAMVLVVVAVFSYNTTANAADAIQSYGKFSLDLNSDGTDDVVFDADDLEELYKLCQ